MATMHSLERKHDKLINGTDDESVEDIKNGMTTMKAKMQQLASTWTVLAN